LFDFVIRGVIQLVDILICEIRQLSNIAILEIPAAFEYLFLT
jgi:hypothetical protein